MQSHLIISFPVALVFVPKELGVFCVAAPEILPGTDSYKIYIGKDNQPRLNKVNQWLTGETKSTLAHQWNISE